VDLKKMVNESLAELTSIDERLGQVAGTVSQRIARAVEANSDRWVPCRFSLSDFLATFPDETQSVGYAVRVGYITEMVDYLGQLRDEVVTEWLQDQSSNAEVDTLRTQRAKVVERLEAAKTLAEATGLKVEIVIPKDPSKRAGGGSSSGGSKVSASNLVFWRIVPGKDKAKMAAGQNTLGSVAFYHTKGLDSTGAKVDDKTSKMSSAELEAYLTKQGIDVLAGGWSHRLANGTVIGADKVTKDEPTDVTADAEAPADDAIADEEVKTEA
jgi:hypothetical protein